MTDDHRDQGDAASSRDDAVYLTVLSRHHSLLAPFLLSSNECSGWPCVILDGASATELERVDGEILHSEVWSAECIASDNGRQHVQRMHKSYLDAGADVITSISYQASVSGYQRVLHVSESRAVQLMGECVRAATRARDDWWRDQRHHRERDRPLVAASIGSFGACLAHGEEYTGDYHGASIDDIVNFQCERIATVTAVEGVDLLMLETMPNAAEIRALIELLPLLTHPLPVILSMSCEDGDTLRDGTPVATIISDILVKVSEQQRSPLWHPGSGLIGIGFNCCSPQYIDSLIQHARITIIDHWQRATGSDGQFTPSMPLIVAYPNSGERYDAQANQWVDSDDAHQSHSQLVTQWYTSGARVIGGCCRTTPTHIAEIRRVLCSLAGGEKCDTGAVVRNHSDAL